MLVKLVFVMLIFIVLSIVMLSVVALAVRLINKMFLLETSIYSLQGILKGKYHCTVDLLFDWFGLVCFTNKNKNSQTGGQWYSHTSTFSSPCSLLYRGIAYCDERTSLLQEAISTAVNSFIIDPRKPY